MLSLSSQQFMMAIRCKAPSTRTLVRFCAATCGCQCFPSCAVSLAYAKFQRHVSRWTPNDLDFVLTAGDTVLGTFLIQKRNLGRWLEMSDILALFLVDSSHHVVKEGTSIYSGLNFISGYDIRSSLDEALVTAEKCTGGAFMTFVGNTTALIPFTVEGSQGQKYAVFDSHARSMTGTLDETGTSVLTYHNIWQMWPLSCLCKASRPSKL